MIPSYNPGEASISSSVGAWVNYFGQAPDKFSCLKESEEKVGEPCVILNGSDDWCAPRESRPQTFVGGLISSDKIIAWYHSGVSGITKSGVIIRHSHLKELWQAFVAKYPGKSFTSAHVKVWRINAEGSDVEDLIKPVGF